MVVLKADHHNHPPKAAMSGEPLGADGGLAGAAVTSSEARAASLTGWAGGRMRGEQAA